MWNNSHQNHHTVELFRFHESPHGLRTACSRLLKIQGCLDDIFPENDPTGDQLLLFGQNINSSKRDKVVKTLQDIAVRNHIGFTVNENWSTSRRGSSATSSNSAATTNHNTTPNQVVLGLTPQLELNFAHSSWAKKLILISKAGVAAHTFVEIEEHFLPDLHLQQFETRVLTAFGRDVRNECIVAFGFKQGNDRKFIWLSDVAVLSQVVVAELTVYLSSDLKLFDEWVKNCDDPCDIGTKMSSFAPEMVPGSGNAHLEPTSSNLVYIKEILNTFRGLLRDFYDLLRDFYDCPDIYNFWLKVVVAIVIVILAIIWRYPH
jgi:hypothetical protein